MTGPTDAPDDGAGLTGVELEIVDSLRRFVRAHNGAGTAVLSYLGRPGWRAVVVATDGAFHDAVLGSRETAARVCARAGIVVADEWTREMSASVRFTAAERRRMGGT